MCCITFSNGSCLFPLNLGSTYTRWGHDSCPSTATLVYKGSMAGAWYSHGGSGANHLCLPFDPQYVADVGNVASAHLYGAEYESVNQLNAGKRNIQNRNIPCAVCRVHARSTVIMVPAHNTCPHSWTREYHLFLMAGANTHGKGNFICMDREMKTLPGHAADRNGHLMYGVTTQCTYGLDCPPYQASKPFTCAVCTNWALRLFVLFCLR